MIAKRNDGLWWVLLPLELGAALLSVGCTLWSGVEGWRIPLMLVVLWLGWYIALAIVLLLGLYIISLTLDGGKPLTVERRFPRSICGWMDGVLCRVARVRITMTGEEHLPEGRFLLVSDHRANYDPITTGWMLRKWDIAFISKPENMSLPIVGPFVRRIYYLPIDRQNPRRALDTINAAADLISQDVASIGVYPEGTRSHSTRMLPFHNGVFKIAQKAEVPIVVLSVDGTERICKNFPWRRTDVALKVCRVIDAETVAASSTTVLGDMVRSSLEDSLGLTAEKC